MPGFSQGPGAKTQVLMFVQRTLCNEAPSPPLSQSLPICASDNSALRSGPGLALGCRDADHVLGC